MFTRTTATNKLLALDKRIRGIAGGTSASKTISILLILIQVATKRENILISIVSESFPHLKRGVIRDFIAIMQQHNYFQDRRWNKTDCTYTFETGSIIEFFSVDQPGKVRGPRRDILFINEANNIPGGYETFTQLEIRTRETIWLDWNPTSEFWFYTDLLSTDNVDFLTLTYKDNEALEPAIIKSIESKRSNANWWKVYGEGQLGELEGKIYNDWKIIDTIPKDAKFECGWLDFGYTNDPTAAGAIYYMNGWYILDELIYQTGLLNKDIADTLKPQLPKDHYVVADSAEPKSIAELVQWGLTVLPSVKGKDSVNNGIQIVQAQKICVTKRSINLLKEYRNYLWMTDRDGRTINVPSPIWNHHLDGIRYAFSVLEPYIDIKEVGATQAPSSKPKLPTFVDEMEQTTGVKIGDAFADAEETADRSIPRSLQ